MRRIDNDTVVLCRRNNGCCPTVISTETGYTITDDYDGKVELTLDEAKMLVEHLESENDLKGE